MPNPVAGKQILGDNFSDLYIALSLLLDCPTLVDRMSCCLLV